jgi:hypothetical protein
MRKKNPKRSARFPDKKRSAENVALWNKEHKEFKLDTLKGFQDRAEKVGRIEDSVMEYIQENPSFIKNKHDLYLTQRAFLNENWVWQNIERPIYRLIDKKILEQREIDDEKRAEIYGRMEQTEDRQREFSRRRIPINTKGNKDRQSRGKVNINQFRQNRRKQQ